MSSGPQTHAVYFLATYLYTEPVTRTLMATVGEQRSQCTTASRAPTPGPSVPLGSAANARAHDRVFTRMLAPLIDGLGHATWSAIVPVSRSRTLSFKITCLLFKRLLHYSCWYRQDPTTLWSVLQCFPKVVSPKMKF